MKWISFCTLFFYATLIWAQTPHAVDSDTIALWNFDNDTLNSVIDSGNNNIDGVSNNSDLNPLPGLSGFGDGRYFTDQTSFIDFGPLTTGHDLDISQLPEWSLEFIIQVDQNLSELRNIFYNGFVSVSLAEGRLSAYVFKNGVNYGIISDTTLSPSQNYNVAIVFENNTLGIVVDGKVISSSPVQSKKVNKKDYGELIQVGGTYRENASILTAGKNHHCLQTESGGLKCWGSNSFGQLGTGDIYFIAAIPLDVVGLSQITKMSAGNDFTCAAKSQKAYCWGNNSSQQLASNLLDYSAHPIGTDLGQNILDIEAGDSHACAILSDKTLKCWGKNDKGQLGLGIVSDSSLPVLVPSLSNIEKISLGSHHTCAVDSSNTVYCWGENTNGQLGASPSSYSSVPTVVTSVLATEISLGDQHSCVKTTMGNINCWGLNSFGQLGNGSTSNSSTPVNVSGLSGDTISKLQTSNSNHTCAITASGNTKCWGSNSDGQLGISNTTAYLTSATLIPNQNNITLFEAGNKTNCFLKQGKSLQCLGRNNGLFGNGTFASSHLPSTALVTRQGYVPGYLDDIRVSSIARFSLSKPEIQLVAPTILVNNLRPTISLSVASSTAIDSLSLDVKLNGISTSGLSYSSGMISGSLNSDLQLGENEIIVSLADVLGNQSRLRFLIRFSPSLNPLLPIMVKTGGVTSCYLDGVGDVYCWGSNQYGQLGRESIKYSSSPVKVEGFKNIVDIAIASHTICAVDRDNSIFCIGSNRSGQLGLGLYIPSRSVPERVYTSLPLVKLRSGSDTFCAVLTDETMECWGASPFNIIGVGAKYIPTKYASIDNIKDVALTRDSACAVKTDDTLWCWGANFSGQLGQGNYTHKQFPVQVTSLSNIDSVKLGQINTCAQTNSGSLYCIGGNSSFQIGNGNIYNWSYPSPELVTITNNISSYELSEGAACALKTNGEIFCWGANAHGEIGDNTHLDSSLGYTIPGINFQQLSMSKNTVCALSNSNEVYCWGANSIGQAGNDNGNSTKIPTKVESHIQSTKVLTSIIAGQANTCMYVNSEPYCWGNNEQWQLGTLSPNYLEVYPIHARSFDGNTSLSIGYGHICLTNNLGEISCIGLNSTGQVGRDPALGTGVRQVYKIPSTSGFSYVRAGLDYSCALKSDGTVWCWGANEHGQLGTGNTTSSYIPQQVTGLTNAVELSISKRGYHNCARKTDGTVWCWGWNNFGQTGAPASPTDQLSPMEALQLKNASQLSLGAEFSCGLKDGQVFCIGHNGYGQSGTGRTGSYSNGDPALVSQVEKIEAGQMHACVLTTADEVFCWGESTYGQVGHGSVINQSIPISVFKNAKDLASGSVHSCAISQNNRLWCWGFNGTAQFGNGDSINSLVPVVSDLTKK